MVPLQLRVLQKKTSYLQFPQVELEQIREPSQKLALIPCVVRDHKGHLKKRGALCGVNKIIFLSIFCYCGRDSLPHVTHIYHFTIYEGWAKPCNNSTWKRTEFFRLSPSFETSPTSVGGITFCITAFYIFCLKLQPMKNNVTMLENFLQGKPGHLVKMARFEWKKGQDDWVTVTVSCDRNGSVGGITKGAVCGRPRLHWLSNF